MTTLLETFRPLPVGDGREACTLADYERLDPIVGAEPTAAEMEVRREAARELCAHCPMIELCGREADRGPYLGLGVWGGSLRYRIGSGQLGRYTVLRLIPEAVPSIHEERLR